MEGIINNRLVKLVEYSTENNWSDQLPNKDWLCILVANDMPRRYIDEVISKIIAKDVGYVCAIGNQAELAHDLVDEEISFRYAEIEKTYLPNHTIVTTWHNDYEDGIWFALLAADSEEFKIKEVVIFAMIDGHETKRVKACLEKKKMKSQI
ncbi:DUF7684 family protein [Rufibacter tibetensis]|uniref:DUF7684 domain-containing protein n=1 Tax=Rufibacter tibetensis TaxID=512763 RepID=A0A0P0CVG8_9BACT|nr:hypothetical protein [Rufibacter tibetensis]ALJ00694.1 hypothetical protein DC20_19065 [Rufibacter tibetensis]